MIKEDSYAHEHLPLAELEMDAGMLESTRRLNYTQPFNGPWSGTIPG